MKYLIYLYTSILVLPTEIKDVHAEGGYVFKRLRLIKWSTILFEVFGDATGTAWEVLLMWEKGTGGS